MHKKGSLIYTTARNPGSLGNVEDDSILFGKANDREIEVVKGMLQDYEKASGQLINLDKSEISFSGGVQEEMRESLARLLGVTRVDKHNVYLGLPANIGRKKKDVFRAVVERVDKKLKNWKTKTLSQAGKLVLIKSVAQAIPNYVLSCFRLPHDVIRRLNSIISNFWWGQRNNERRIHWVAWGKMGKLKEDGGLGFRDLAGFNKAMLAKQCWRLVRDNTSLLFRTLKARYFPRNGFLNAKVGYNPSYTWRSILAGRELLLKGLRWVVGDGTQVNVWDDPWLPDSKYFKVSSPRGDLPDDMSVRDLILPDLEAWDKPKIEQIFSMDEARMILQIPILQAGRPDHLSWHFSKNGIYTVKSGYHMACNETDEENGAANHHSRSNPIWSHIWSLTIPPKLKIFLWRCVHNALPVASELNRRGVSMDLACMRCGVQPETIGHAIWDCGWCYSLRETSQLMWPSEINESESIKSKLSLLLRGEDKGTVARQVALLWMAWYARNQTCFQNSTPSLEYCADSARRLLDDYWKAQVPHTARVKENRHQRWNPPSHGYTKLNTDASVSTELGTGLGGVLRDSMGAVVQCFAELLNERLEVVMAEAVACRRGLQMAHQLGVENLIIEVDSQILHCALLSGREDLSYFGSVVDDILQSSRNFQNCKFCWVRRSANRLAHNLSRFAFDVSLHGSFMGLIPSQFQDIVSFEAPA